MSIDYSALGSAKEAELTQLLRQYADVAEAGGKSHWATAMRRAIGELTLAKARIGKLEELSAHMHVAMYRDGVLIDACQTCGLDLRDRIHRRKTT